MISIAKLGGAGQASSYYDKADYYTKGQEKADISSKFSGEMAKDLKLEGAIDKKEFTKLLNGITPDGQQLGTTRGGKNEHTPGWDLTFSAPKSLSILALVGNDKALIKAHQASVDSTLKYLEKNILKGRIHASGQTIPVDLKKALFAQFTHTTSRKLDPQLHTHSVLLNMGVDKFGNTRSIDSRAIYDNSMLLGQIYRNELARHAKELGYNVVWDAKKGLFEIGGVDEKLLKNFSKRSEEIRQIASEKGVDSAKDLEKITLATRENKKNISGDEVTNSWDKQVTELNLDPSKLVDSAKEHSKKYENQNAKRNMFGGKFSFKKESIDEKAMFGVQKAVEHLSYYDSAFKEKDLLKEVLLFTREHVGIEKITESLDKLKKEGLVIESNSHEGMLT
ncbi:MAG: conjugative relaxase-like TrwC/TraI family protein, partial [Halioglobus sp.]